MQLLCDSTEEGNSKCLGIIPIVVEKFSHKDLKVPHMGWNSIKKMNNDNLFSETGDNEYYYFAHSYFIPQNEFTTSTCNYGLDFSASLRFKNFYGVQFHPEKSSQQGIRIIKNFLKI
jgi:glutamine amidotransferase